MIAGPVLAAASAALEAGRAGGVAPALAAAVLREGRVVHASWHGVLPVAGAGERALRPDDLFDIASLTKVMATTTLAAQLADAGTLDLDAPASRWLPGFEAAGKGAVTARHLLGHSSGLPAWRPYHERCAADPVAGRAFLAPGARPPFPALREAFARGRALVAAAVREEALEAPPGTHEAYSDPGFIALGLALEVAAGEPLAALADARVFRPLGLASTFFLDGLEPAAARARAEGRAFVPARHSGPRGEVVQGAVDDDTAWAMGGTAGHAGVFSTATDVAAVGQAWLEAVHGRGGVVPVEAARAFARPGAAPGSGRGLGWDVPTGETSLGTRLGRGPRGAVGHLGFTGCSLWIDLDAAVVVALLTNHCHPAGVDRDRIRAFRRAFHDGVAEALGIR